MPSNIDFSKPIFGHPTTESVRNNFQIAQTEITDLQDFVEEGPFIPVDGGIRMTGLFELYDHPRGNYEPATKQYVDEIAFGVVGTVPEVPLTGMTYARGSNAPNEAANWLTTPIFNSLSIGPDYVNIHFGLRSDTTFTYYDFMNDGNNLLRFDRTTKLLEVLTNGIPVAAFSDSVISFNKPVVVSAQVTINPPLHANNIWVNRPIGLKLGSPTGSAFGILTINNDPTTPYIGITRYAGQLDIQAGNATSYTQLISFKKDNVRIATSLNVINSTLFEDTVTLALDPVLDLEAVTKRYVDTTLADSLLNYLPLAGGTMRGGIHWEDANDINNMDTSLHLKFHSAGMGIGVTQSRLNYNVPGGVSAHVFLWEGNDIASINNIGINMYPGTVINLVANPTAPLQAAPKQYVDLFLPLAGGTMSGGISFGTMTDSGNSATNKHLTLHTDGYGIGVTTNRQNYIVPFNSAHHHFLVAGADITNINNTGQTFLNAMRVTLGGDPTAAMHAVTKQYTDARNALYLPLLGGTMQGSMYLFHDPIEPTEPVTKQYSDIRDEFLQSEISILAQDLYFVGGINVVEDKGNYTLVVTNPPAEAPYPPYPDNSPLPAARVEYKGFYLIVTQGGTSPATGSNIPYDTYALNDWLVCDGQAWYHLGIGQANLIASNVGIAPPIGQLGLNVQTGLTWLDTYKVNKFGDTLTGFLSLWQDPTAPMHAVTKQYADARFGLYLPLTGGTLSGGLHFGQSIVANINDLSRHIDLYNGAFGFNIQTSRINYVVPANNSHYFIVGTNSILNINTGGIQMFAGDIYLRANPTSNMMATTKQYVDTQDALYLLLTGGTLTGPLYIYPPTDTWPLFVNGNCNGVIPTTTFGGYFGFNFSAGQCEFDFVNAHTLSGTQVGGFNWYQYVNTTTLRRLMNVSGIGHLSVASGIDVGSLVASAASDLSKHIALFSNSYGLSITSGRLNIVSPQTIFVNGVTDILNVTAGGIQMFAGNVNLRADPTSALHAATKQYVDTKSGAYLPLAGGTMLGGISFGAVMDTGPDSFAKHIALYGSTDGIGVTAGRMNIKSASNVYFRIGTVDVVYVNNLGLTMSPGKILTLSGAPTAALHAASKQYVDDQVVISSGGGVLSFNTRVGAITLTAADVSNATGLLRTGGAMTGNLTINPSAQLKFTQVNSDPALVTGGIEMYPGFGGFGVTSSTLNYNWTGVHSFRSAGQQVMSFNNVGLTMYKPLTLSGNPTATLHAVTKQYVDLADSIMQADIAVLAQDLYFVGGINVVTDQGNYTAVTGLADLSPLPAPGAAYKGFFLIVTTGGQSKAGNIPSDTYTPGDWIVCDGLQWVHLGIGQTTVLASQVAISPAIGSLGANVQTGLAWLNTNKLNANAARVNSFNNRTGVVTLAKSDVDAAGGPYLPLTGGSLTNFLTLHAAPTANLHAATKLYVDTKVDSIPPPVAGGVTSFNTRVGAITLTEPDVSSAGGPYLKLTGGTLSNGLSLGNSVASGPTVVTRHIALHGTSYGFSITGGTLNQISGGTIAMYPAGAIVSSFNAAGLTMNAGAITLKANPTSNLHAVTKQYVDAADNLLKADISILAQDLFFVGGINILTDQCNFTNVVMLPDLSPLPAPVVGYKGYFLIVTTGGQSKAGNIPSDTYTAGDWLVCDGLQWFHLGIGNTNIIASNVAISPAIGSLGANVQTGLAWLNANKLSTTAPKVDSFNTRTGAVTLTEADVSAAGGPYLKLTGGSLSNGINFGSTIATPNNWTVSRHIALFGSTYGFGVTSSRLNIVSGANTFIIAGTTDIASFTTGGMNLLTGQITLKANPTAALHAATKQYVDNNAGVGKFLPLTGGTVSGPTTFSGSLNVTGGSTIGAMTVNGAANFAGTATVASDPTSARHIASKQYVDNNAGNGRFLPLSGGTLSGLLNVDNNIIVRRNGGTAFVGSYDTNINSPTVLGMWNTAGVLHFGWAWGDGSNTQSVANLTGDSYFTCNKLFPYDQIYFRYGGAGFFTDANYTSIIWDSSNWAIRYDRASGYVHFVRGYDGADNFVIDPAGNTYAFGRIAAQSGHMYFGLSGGAGILQMWDSWYWLWQNWDGVTSWQTPSGGFFYLRNLDWWIFNNFGPFAGHGGYIELSDDRTKVNVSPVTIGLEAIMNLIPVSFRRVIAFKDGPKTNVDEDIGFSAQQVKGIIPQAVKNAGILLPDGSGGLDSADPTLGLSTTPIVAALVNSVKTLAAMITTLTDRINVLEGTQHG
jgi:hypothetical protein